MLKQQVLTELEKEEIVKFVKGGEFLKLNDFLGLFNRYIESIYYANECSKHKISLDDFHQDCCEAVLRALQFFKGNTYGELCSFTVKTIKNRAVDLSKKHKRQNKYNVLVAKAEDIHHLASKNIVYSLENEVVNRLTMEHSKEKFIKKILTKKEYGVLQVFYLDKCPRQYELENGLKYRSFDKTLRRAFKKIAKIVGTKEFMDFHFCL